MGVKNREGSRSTSMVDGLCWAVQARTWEGRKDADCAQVLRLLWEAFMGESRFMVWSNSGWTALALGYFVLALGCASGDGVPTATIENGLDTCIVEASYLEYGFSNPIGPSGRMAPREVREGSAVAYAVVMAPEPGENCVDLAGKRGGSLWITHGAFEAKAGELTSIRFSKDTASEIPTECSPQYVEGLKRFSRLKDACDPNAGK